MPQASGTSLNANVAQQTGEYAAGGVGVLRKTVAFNANILTAVAQLIGTLPNNCVILSTSGIDITTAFNGTTPTMSVGYAADSLGAAVAAAYTSAQAMGATGFFPLNALAAAAALPRGIGTQLTATLSYTTTTAGQCDIIINYALG